jgi:SARP family transcriptional regulator, regulator of embCAB operon
LITLFISAPSRWLGATLEGSGWLEVGDQDVLRIYLTSQVRVEHGDVLIGERDLPGRQGRVVLAFLVAERDRPATRDELAEELWLDQPPAAWDKAVMAVVSKLRAALRRASLGDSALATSFGCYQLRIPADTWVDIEAAADAVHRAETALAAGDPRAAYPWAYVAYHVARRPFLAGEDGPWVRRKRIQLREIHLRALDCTVECAAANGEMAEAIQAAEDALAVEPFRETTYQRLMRVHAAAGNRAEALRAYERCRTVLAEELGVPPSPETEAVYTAVVRA